MKSLFRFFTRSQQPANAFARRLRAAFDRLELADRLWAVRATSHGHPADRAPGEPSMLVVDTWVPTPDRDSGSLRMFNLMQAAQRVGFRVSFVPHAFRPGDEPYFAALRSAGIRAPSRAEIVSPRHELRAHGRLYDVVLLSRADIAARYLDAARRNAPRARLVYDTVDLHFVRERREAEMHNDRRALAASDRRREQEIDLTRRADFVFAVSASERDVLQQACPEASILVVSNIHEPRPTATPFEQRTDLLFLGGFRHPPNVDAVLFFAEQVWPSLAGDLADARFVVVGADPPQSIRSLASDRILVTGHVQHLEPWLERARISVAPLRYGAGVKGKINTAMSYGVPVVTTPVGAEGMELCHERDVLIASDASAFADEVRRLWSDQELWHKLVEGGLRSIERTFSFGAAETAIRRIRAELHTA